MARFKRLTLIFSAISMAICCLVIQQPKTVNAWSGNLPTCDLSVLGDWQQSWSDNGGPSLSNSDKFVIAKRAPNQWIYIMKLDNLEFNRNLADDNLRMSTTQAYVQVYNEYGYIITWPTYNGNLDDFDCISYANNATYDSSWNTYSFPTFDFGDDTELDECPDGQLGTPPDCTTPPPDECPDGQSGTPPDCVDDTPPDITHNQAMQDFAQKLGIVIAFVISGWFVYQFRFTRFK